MTVPGGNDLNYVAIVTALKLAYDQVEGQKELDKMTAQLQRAMQKNTQLQARLVAKEMTQQSKAEFAAQVEQIRLRIQNALDSMSRRPRDRATVLSAAGLDARQIAAANVELDRAGSSVRGMERALRRVNIPAPEARAMAMALKEATYEAQAYQSEINKIFFRFRRIAEQGVRLSELGFNVAAGGAGILAPLTLAANQYVQRYRTMEDAAARFTAAQYNQQQAISRLGREATTALIPVLEELTRLLDGIAQIAQDNPDLVRAVVMGGAGLAAAGSMLVLIGRLESVVGRIGAFFFSQAPGSIYLPGLLGNVAGGIGRTLGVGRGTEGGSVGITPIGGGLLRVGVSVALVAGLTQGLLSVVDRLAETSEGFTELKRRMDVTGDGVLDLNDVLAALRTALFVAFETLIDGFFRVATAIVNFIEQIGSFPERIQNWIQGRGFVTNVTAQQQSGTRAELETAMAERQRLQDLLDLQALPMSDLQQQLEMLSERYSEAQRELIRLDRGLQAPGMSDPATRMVQQELIRQQEAYLQGLDREITRTVTAIQPEARGFDRQSIEEELAALDETIARLQAQLQNIVDSSEGLSPAAAELEAERVRVLQEFRRSGAEFVRSGDLGSLLRAFGNLVTPGDQTQPRPEGFELPEGVTPEGLALFAAYAQAELQAEQQFRVQLADANRQFRLQELEAERQYQRQREDMARRFQRSERDAAEKFAFDSEQRRIEFARREADIERKRQEDRLKKLREAELRLTELAAARDVAGFIEARKRFELEMREEERQAAIDKANRQRDFDLETADRLRQYEEQRRLARRAYDEQLEDAERAYQEQRSTRQRQFDEQLAQMRVEFDRQRDMRFRDFAQQLDDLRASQGELTEERRAFNNQVIAGYQELMNAHTTLLSDALKQAYGMAQYSQLNPPQTFGTTGTTGGSQPRAVTIRRQIPYIGPFQTGSRAVQRLGYGLLHPGERVLTAGANRQFGALLDSLEAGHWPMGGTSISIVVSGNAFGDVASKDDVRELASAIVQGIGDSWGRL